MTTYQITSTDYVGDGKIYTVVNEYDDNGTPGDLMDDTFVQEISRVQIGLIADLKIENIVAKGKVLAQRILDLEARVDLLENP